MTTIAWDGKTLAADGQSMLGSLVVSITTKKIKVSNGIDKWFVMGHEVLAVAIAGDTGSDLLISNMLTQDVTPHTIMPEHYDFAMIAVARGGGAFLLASNEGSTGLHITRINGPYAIGNGDVIAITAMRCGKSAREAVEMACELNVYTGGEITEWSR